MKYNILIPSMIIAALEIVLVSSITIHQPVFAQTAQCYLLPPSYGGEVICKSGNVYSKCSPSPPATRCTTSNPSYATVDRAVYDWARQVGTPVR